MNDNEYANMLSNKGYCRISNAGCIISRIDRPDWKEVIARSHPDGMDWVDTLGEAGAEDQYRRCFSKDKLTVSEDIFNRVLPSGGTVTGYCQAINLYK